jgi:hypothetical protein
MPGIARLFTQTATVETYLGTGIHGPTYAAAVTVACFVNDGHKLVRDGNGEQVVASTTLYAPLGAVETFAPQSRVTVNGRAAQVIAAYRRDSAGPASAYHAHIELT